VNIPSLKTTAPFTTTINTNHWSIEEGWCRQRDRIAEDFIEAKAFKSIES
jgi:hypothetical protein